MTLKLSVEDDSFKPIEFKKFLSSNFKKGFNFFSSAKVEGIVGKFLSVNP